MLKLSICIPTYNFGKFIAETLDSIIPQLDDQTEVVVLDGGSTDNTSEIVQYYQSICPHIRYFRQSERGGIDKDMHLSVEKAQGEYCWLFSSDDVMQQNAIATILSEIKENHDVYLCNFTICGLDIKNTIKKHFILKGDKSLVFDLSDELIRKQYFNAATATPAFFSFMSSLVIKRSRWLETTGHQPDFFGSCWAHVARIFRMIPKGLTVKYLPLSFLRKRSFNDSFMDKGFIHRISIAIDGYQEIADIIFGASSFEAFNIRRALRHEFPLSTFLSAKQHARSNHDRKSLWRLYNKTYVDIPYRRHICSIFLLVTPARIISLLRYVYRLKKRIVGRLRLSHLKASSSVS